MKREVTSAYCRVMWMSECVEGVKGRVESRDVMWLVRQRWKEVNDLM